MNAQELFDEECDGQIMFISGFSNPKLRARAQINTRPTKVKIKVQSFTSHMGTEYHTATAYLFNADGTVGTTTREITHALQAFYSVKECTEFYNESVDKVLKQVETFKKSIDSNRLKVDE